MSILNSIQSREYNRAQTLTRFFNESKSIYSSCEPFANEVTAFLHNVEQVSDYASIKEKRGTGITIERKKLKQTIAREVSHLCNVVTAYALTKADNILLYAVSYTYTEIYTLKTCDLFTVINNLVNNIAVLFAEEEFVKYGITPDNLSSLLEKAKRYSSTNGQARILNIKSQVASGNITNTLKKIKGNIAQFNRLLTLFGSTHPEFVTGFQEACIINNTEVRYNTIEGNIKDSSTGEPVAEVTITGEGKNKTAVTNASGFYRLAGIKTGTYTLTIAAKGYTTEMVTVKVIRGKTIELDINIKVQPFNISSVEAA